MFDRYQTYLDWFDRERDKNGWDSEPEDYDEFWDNYEEWNRDDFDRGMIAR